MGLPRCLSSPGVSALINVCATFFLVANMVQNQYAFHDRAVREQQRAEMTTTIPVGDRPPPPPPGGGDDGDDDRGGDEGRGDDVIPAIGLTIPRGKAVALPSVRISEAEEKGIRRSFYGGKGDKPHLGGFTEFDVSYYIYCTMPVRARG